MSLVVDASVALLWFIEQRGTARALDVLEHGGPLAAPELIVAETCNAGWRLERRGEAHPEQVDAIAALLPGRFSRLHALMPLASRATQLARVLAHPVYDCFYLALAERESVPLITADDRLIAAVRAAQLRMLVVSLFNWRAPR